MTEQDHSGEWSRLASVPTVARGLSGHVVDLAALTGGELPGALRQLRLLPGWHPARINSDLAQPARIAVAGPRPSGGWDGCETVSAFRFTGTPPEALIHDATQRMLRELGIEAGTSRSVRDKHRQARGVQSSGYLTVAGQRIWLQYNAYLSGSESPGGGILIEQGIFSTPDLQDGLRDDIAELTRTVYDAFIDSIKLKSKTTARGITHWSSLDDLLRAKGVKLSTLSVQPYDDVGVPSILINADRDGMRILRTAMQSAHEHGEGNFKLDGIHHHIFRQPDAAEIELGARTVTWRFDGSKIAEILYMMEPLMEESGPGHQYIDDIKSPVETIILSVDEYVGSAPYGEFPQLSEHPPSTQ